MLQSQYREQKPQPRKVGPKLGRTIPGQRYNAKGRVRFGNSRGQKSSAILECHQPQVILQLTAADAGRDPHSAFFCIFLLPFPYIFLFCRRQPVYQLTSQYEIKRIRPTVFAVNLSTAIPPSEVQHLRRTRTWPVSEVQHFG